MISTTPRKPTLLVAASALAAFASAGTANAAVSFGVNFSVNGANYTTGTYLGTSDWTSSFAAEGNQALTAGTFATTESGVTVDFAASNFWNAGQWGTAGASDQGLNVFRDYLDDGDTIGGTAPASLGTLTTSDGIGVAIRISGLSAWLASNNATSYNLTLLLNTDTTGGTFATYTVRAGDAQGTALASAAGLVQGSGNWDGVQALSTASGGTSTEGIRGSASFASLTADAVTVTAPSRNSSVRGTIAGFLVTAVPEPSTYGLLGAGALAGLALARRRKRRA